MGMQTGGDNDEVMSEINVTPLVDVMLVLLVVFIVTAPLLTNAVHVNLPKTASTAPPPQDSIKPVQLEVTADGRYLLEEREVAYAELESELLRLRGENPELKLRLGADEAVPYGQVARAMAVVERAGITKISVLTVPQ
jgi:biopolymer transport protein ExbD